jgi:putative endonuclease
MSAMARPDENAAAGAEAGEGAGAWSATTAMANAKHRDPINQNSRMPVSFSSRHPPACPEDPFHRALARRNLHGPDQINHERVFAMTQHRPLIATYMMSNRHYGTLYIGATSNLYGRVRQHKAGVFEGFTSRYALNRLVWFEPHELIVSAIRREKRLKHYLRAWKINLIERDNPHWEDLSLTWDLPPVWKHDPK